MGVISGWSRQRPVDAVRNRPVLSSFHPKGKVPEGGAGRDPIHNLSDIFVIQVTPWLLVTKFTQGGNHENRALRFAVRGTGIDDLGPHKRRCRRTRQAMRW